MAPVKRFVLFAILALIVSFSGSSFSRSEEAKSYLLRWNPEPYVTYVYNLSSSGTGKETISFRTERFDVRVVKKEDGVFHFLATGERVPDRAPLAYRVQRALFPEFSFTVDELGKTEIPSGQPFPPFANVPLFPERAVSVGSSWSGGPVGILPDPHAGMITFNYTSTLTGTTSFRGKDCVVIETDYKVALAPDAKSYMPFLGLVEGDEPAEPGKGAPVGGVVEGSRAHRAGIRPGDLIIKAQGQRIRGWGGLEELVPILVPEKEIEFTVLRDGTELVFRVAPEGVPLAYVSASGALHSVCYFSLEEGLPLRVEITSEDLVFTLTDAEGKTEERRPEIHLIFEYQSRR